MLRSLRTAAVLATLALTAGAQDPDSGAPEPAGKAPPSFRVDVKLVNVYATVTDKNGAPVTDLTKADFAIAEDGNPERTAVFEQESEHPISVVLALDTSSSIRKDLRVVQDSARRFVSATIRRQDRLALFQFAEEVREVVPFTSDFQRIANGIRNLRNGSGTVLYDAVYLGSKALMQRDGRKVMVLITDGGDTLSSVGFHEAVRAANLSEALVYCVIVVPVAADPGRDVAGEHALIQIAHDTGGKSYYADSPAALDSAFQQISKEIRTQYLLAYYPSRRNVAGDYRKIDVQITRPGAELQVRHRAGYYITKLE